MSKIYIEARFKMPVLDTDEFGYDKEEVEKVDWEEFAKDDFWNSCEDMGELENKYDITFHKVQPKLSIPKKIADSIVKLAKYHQTAATVNGDVFGILDATEWLVNFMSAGRESVMNPELFDYLNQDKSGHIETCIAFMNPLTRPFVEVEG